MRLAPYLRLPIAAAKAPGLVMPRRRASSAFSLANRPPPPGSMDFAIRGDYEWETRIRQLGFSADVDESPGGSLPTERGVMLLALAAFQLSVLQPHRLQLVVGRILAAAGTGDVSEDVLGPFVTTDATPSLDEIHDALCSSTKKLEEL